MRTARASTISRPGTRPPRIASSARWTNSSPSGMPRGGRAKPPDTPTGGPMKRTLLFSTLVPLLAWAGARSSGPEDESVFVTGLRAGQHESLLYVWTSDADAKDPDFLSVVDADPKSPSYAKVIATAPTGSTVDNEAHHFGYTVNTDRIFAGGLVSNRLFIYDVRVKPELNRMVTSSWTHPHHFRGNPVAPENVGDAVAVWDWKAGKVLQVEHLEKMPLEVRWMHGPGARGGFINCAGASTIWYWEDKDGKLGFSRVIQLPANSTPADVRISYDNRLLYVSLFAGNAVQQYDVSDPLHPKFISEVKLDEPNMMKLTPDSRRLYVSNSLLSNLDGKVPFRVRLLNVGPQGMTLDEKFDVDFDHFPTGAGRPHDMLLK